MNKRETAKLDRWDRRQQRAEDRRLDPPASRADLASKTCGDPACYHCRRADAHLDEVERQAGLKRADDLGTV